MRLTLKVKICNVEFINKSNPILYVVFTNFFTAHNLPVFLLVATIKRRHNHIEDREKRQCLPIINTTTQHFMIQTK